MSQNRQSEEDRESAEINQVNLHTAQEIEALHQKIDDLHTSTLQNQSRQLSELVKLLRQPAAANSDVSVQPSYQYLAKQSIRPIVAEPKEFSSSMLLPLNSQTNLQTKHKFNSVEAQSLTLESSTLVSVIPAQANSIDNISAK
ncbi:MAG: DUF1003 domain-containing protein [Plectolyngbya sp. WJT66-NPBG17]|jgi:hypothetical protein|nr:DUF1003 domain-containing protein [Plectolyngbya sp. WJT66-NPBG17]